MLAGLLREIRTSCGHHPLAELMKSKGKHVSGQSDRTPHKGSFGERGELMAPTSFLPQAEILKREIILLCSVLGRRKAIGNVIKLEAIPGNPPKNLGTSQVVSTCSLRLLPRRLSWSPPIFIRSQLF